MSINKITRKLTNSVNSYLDYVPLDKKLVTKLPNPEKAEDTKDLFIEIANLRNELAEKQNYKNFLIMSMEKYGIKNTQISNFLKNSAIVAKKINQSLDIKKIAEFENRCPTCEMEDFPFRNKEQVVNFFTNKYSFLKEHINNIEIKEGEYSQTFYSDTNQLSILLDERSNSRHKLKDLFHEMCHVSILLESLHTDKAILSESKYEREKKAIDLEYELSKEVSESFHQSFLFDSLLNMREVLFEIRLYNNPNQNLDKLFAKTHNEIFYKSAQEINHMYLFSKDILFRPLYSLPHAISYYEILDSNY